MVLCIIALPVFAILGIFSVKYRKLTLDSLDCIFRTVTFRKCRSSLDDRIKSYMAGKTLKVSPVLSGVIYKNYKLISWIILIIFLWSIYGTSVGIYNYAQYGNCNGPSDTGFCMLDPTGQNTKTSEIEVDKQSKVIYAKLEGDDPIIGNKNAELTIIEFGCYACPYTKKAEPTVKEVLDYYKGKVNLQFKTFYIPHHNMSYRSALAANCAQEQGKYIEYHNSLFENQEQLNEALLHELANNLGMNITKFDECLLAEKYKNEVESDTLAGVHAGVAGTPTFFVNEQKIVGPKPLRTFKTIIDEELKKPGK